MRDIIFRGKRIDNGEWVYGGFYRGIMPETENPFSLDNARIKTIIVQEGTYYHVIPDTVGQYTGLKDKNGKEIYEGDIVRHNYGFGNGKGIVCYSAPNLELKHLNKNEVCNDFTWDEWELFEIIGNIHDNPELLGESYHEN